MGSFGERMQRERHKRGITLDAVSQTTKIGTHILEALEKDEFDKLPGGIFNKGFVREYARFLGMDEQKVLKEFIEVAGDPEQPLPDPPIPRRPEIPQPKGRLSWGGVATVLLCAIALLFGGWKAAGIVRLAAGARWSRVHSNRQPAMPPVESGTSSKTSQANEESSGVPATHQPEKVATATLQPASQTTATPAPELISAPGATQRFVILVKARKPVWVSLTADGKPVLEGVLKRKKKVRAYSQVVLKTKNAGALAVARDGKPLPPLGEQDQETTVTFTCDSVTRE
jgi:cytoskeleton protein RodZ